MASTGGTVVTATHGPQREHDGCSARDVSRYRHRIWNEFTWAGIKSLLYEEAQAQAGPGSHAGLSQ